METKMGKTLRNHPQVITIWEVVCLNHSQMGGKNDIVLPTL